MTEQTQKPLTHKTRKKRAHRRPDIYREFVVWISVFETLREPKTQEEFAKKFRVNQGTLSDWKKTKEFWDDVEIEWRKMGKERTSNIMQKFYDMTMREGRSTEIKLWFQYFLNWQEKQQMRIESEDIKELTQEIKKITESWKQDDNTRDHEPDGSGSPADGRSESPSQKSI